MDYTREPQRVLSFCTGYGGIELGLERAGMVVQPVAYVEIEAFAIHNLVEKIEKGFMGAAPVWSNLKTFPVERFRGRVDGLIGGYPCQPFSAAGKRKGEDDPRHLWPFIQGAVAAIRPRWCFFENVIGHLTCGFKNVCHDLGELGYILTAGIFSASEVGLPHQRKRVFILAHSCGTRAEIGIPGQEQGEEGVTEEFDHNSCGPAPARPGQPQEWWEPPRVIKPEMDRSINGTPDWMGDADLRETYQSLAVGCDNRTDELRCLGNGVVPATAARAFMTLWKELEE